MEVLPWNKKDAVHLPTGPLQIVESCIGLIADDREFHKDFRSDFPFFPGAGTAIARRLRGRWPSWPDRSGTASSVLPAFVILFWERLYPQDRNSVNQRAAVAFFLVFPQSQNWSPMFDSQVASLASLTFLVQVLGAFLVIVFRLRSQASINNLVGLMAGMLLMAGSAIACLMTDPSWGTIQGVAVVAVAIGATIGRTDVSSATF